jgi:hypothetical protein
MFADKPTIRQTEVSRPMFTDNTRPAFPDVSRPMFADVSKPMFADNPYSRQVPTLSQLNMNDKNHIPNMDYMSSNMEEDDLKRELIFKFELLKKSYKDASIPEFSIHSDYRTMKQAYDTTLKRLSVDSIVGNYKTYLIGGFMVVEYALGNWMGFDMQGFTQQQITSMESYERLLIELGEKSYVDEESQWPVEARLLGMIVINAGFFIVSKMISKKTGANILSMINSMNMNNVSQDHSGIKKKRPMRGPNIDIDNLPDLGTYG